jgi:hypothetical protein
MKPGLKYGLIAAAGMSAWMLGEYVLGLHSTHIRISDYTGFGVVLIFLGALWRMLHRQLYLPNRTWLPVWEGLLHGLVASLVTALGFYVFLSLYLHFINPEYADLTLEQYIAVMRADGRSEESIRALAREFRWSQSPVGLPFYVFKIYLTVGVIASPLLTLWLNWRRKEQPIHAR